MQQLTTTLASADVFHNKTKITSGAMINYSITSPHIFDAGPPNSKY